MVNVRVVPNRVVTLPTQVINCPAGSSTNVLPSYTQSANMPVGRFIQNGDPNNILYFAIDTACVAAKQIYHGFILPNQQLDCSGYTGPVNCDCLASTGANGIPAITTQQMAVDYTGGVVD